MSKLPSMPFFTSDFFADTLHLSGEAQALYMLMLAHAWQRQGSLPGDETELRKLLRINKKHWDRLKNEVLPFWHTAENGTKINLKLSQIWNEISTKVEINRQNGALGGRPKLLINNDKTKPNGLFSETERLTERLTNQNQNHIYKKPFLFNESRQESGSSNGGGPSWVRTKRIGTRLFKAGEYAPKYEGQPSKMWEILKPEDCT